MIVLARKAAYSFLGAGFLVLIGILVVIAISDQDCVRHIQIPLHASLEAVGGVTAILVALILYEEEVAPPLVGLQITALGLLGMGIFDLFHSASVLGDSFVWLRSFSSLIGGVGYALAWLPAPLLTARRRNWLLGGVLMVILVVAGGLTSSHLPPALISGHFSNLAVKVNVFAALLFVLGSIRLLSAFHRSQRIEYYLLACFGLLNAASGFELPLSSPWDMTWWFWHGLRFLGMGVAGFLLMYRQLETRQGLSRALADLQRANLTIQEQAEAELRAREVEFTKVANILPGPVARVNLEGRYLFANAAFERWFGKPPAEVVGRTQAEVLGEEFYRRVQPNIQRAMAGEMVIYEIATISPDGEPLYGQVSLLPDFDTSGKPRGHFTIAIDISELRRSEESLRVSQAALQKTNRTYALLSAVNQTMVRQREPLAIYAEACRIAVELGGFRMAWVGVPDALGSAIKPVAQAGDDQGYVAQLAIALDGKSRGQGPTGTALRCGEHVVANDIAQDPGMVPWREAALARGYLASAAFPIVLDGEVVATLNLYSGEKGFFSAEELQLLDGLAADIAFALEVSDRDEKRLAAEEALRRAARNWETTFSAITDAICLLDLEQNIVNANRAMLELFGKKLAEVVGRRCCSLVHGAEGVVSQCPLALVLVTGKRASQELTIRGRFFEVIADPILDRKGEIVGLVHTMRDITGQKQDREEIGKLSQAVEQSPASMIITDLKGNIEYVNPIFEKVSGYSLEEVRGKNPRLLRSGHTSATEYRALWETIMAGKEWRGELHNRRKDGTLFWERAVISPIRNREGQITNFLAVKEDITEQKHLGEQLQRAQRLESVGRLAGGVAHDLNNMLGVIMGYTELALQSGETPEELRDDLLEVKKAAQHSVEVTRQLLAFASRQVVSPQVLDLNLAFENMLKLLQRLLGEDVQLDWRPTPGLWPVKVDPAQVEQVLANLVVNARDAMVHGGTLSISTANVQLDEFDCQRWPGATPGDYCLLTVSDTGTGMDEATLARIFEPFFTTKEFGQGTGLGLATVYGIIRQSLGFIEVGSQPGQGTTFRVYLPRTQGEVVAKSSEVAEPAVSPGNETILLVEDEEAVLALCQRFLGKHGYTVLVASTPGMALELAASHPGPVHLLVTDMVMPEMNGMELIEKIGKFRPGIRSILMSGYTGDVLIQKELLVGKVNFLSKPFGDQELNALVRETLARE